MKEQWKDIGLIALAFALLAAISLPMMPQRFSAMPDLPAIETVSGEGIALEGNEVLIDINSAGVGLLCHLPGIGEVMAQRIVDHRAQNGPFASVDALLDVKGIGPATLEAIRSGITAR